MEKDRTKRVQRKGEAIFNKVVRIYGIKEAEKKFIGDAMKETSLPPLRNTE